MYTTIVIIGKSPLNTNTFELYMMSNNTELTVQWVANRLPSDNRSVGQVFICLFDAELFLNRRKLIIEWAPIDTFGTIDTL